MVDIGFGRKKKAPVAVVDPLLENTKEIENIKKRLADLERNQLKMEKELEKREKGSITNLHDFEEQINRHKKQIKEMKADLKEFIEIVMLFVKELQNTAKTEDMEKLQRAVDYWTPESWLTRNELIRLTKRVLEEGGE